MKLDVHEIFWLQIFYEWVNSYKKRGDTHLEIEPPHPFYSRYTWPFVCPKKLTFLAEISVKD